MAYVTINKLLGILKETRDNSLPEEEVNEDDEKIMKEKKYNKEK
jgi:hypothetical protein